jgi:hypothetical protein
VVRFAPCTRTNPGGPEAGDHRGSFGSHRAKLRQRTDSSHRLGDAPDQRPRLPPRPVRQRTDSSHRLGDAPFVVSSRVEVRSNRRHEQVHPIGRRRKRWPETPDSADLHAEFAVGSVWVGGEADLHVDGGQALVVDDDGVGAELYLAEKTVKNYVSHLLTKLGFRRRTEVAALSARLQERKTHGTGG